MRYEIVKGEIRDSIWIDAPYDTKSDAQEAISEGVTHNCSVCHGSPDVCKRITE